MKALVIGGSGFIGSHLVDQALLNGWQVKILDIGGRRYEPDPQGVEFIQGDLTRLDLVRDSLEGVDVVYHLAWTTIHETATRDPAADVTANLIPSIRLFETCIKAGVPRVVFTSSGGTVYGKPLHIPIAESHPKNPLNAYGITKLATEKYLQMFGHLYGLDFRIIRPSTPYGPRQNPLSNQGAAAVFLHRVTRQLPVKIWGDGSVTRDFFYISDLVRALMTVAEKDLPNHKIFNIGGGKPVSLIELLSEVEVVVGRRAIIEFEAPRRFDADQIVLDTRLARDHLEWTPLVELSEGLDKTWSWIKSNIR